MIMINYKLQINSTGFLLIFSSQFLVFYLKIHQPLGLHSQYFYLPKERLY